MFSFILRRLAFMVPLLLLISVLVFFLMNASPGDALDELRARRDVKPELVAQLEKDYGYKNAKGEPNPWYVRYGFWLNTASPIKFIDDQKQFTWHLRPVLASSSPAAESATSLSNSAHPAF